MILTVTFRPIARLRKSSAGLVLPREGFLRLLSHELPSLSQSIVDVVELVLEVTAVDFILVDFLSKREGSLDVFVLQLIRDLLLFQLFVLLELLGRDVGKISPQALLPRLLLQPLNSRVHRLLAVRLRDRLTTIDIDFPGSRRVKHRWTVEKLVCSQFDLLAQVSVHWVVVKERAQQVSLLLQLL